MLFFKFFLFYTKSILFTFTLKNKFLQVFVEAFMTFKKGYYLFNNVITDKNVKLY